MYGNYSRNVNSSRDRYHRYPSYGYFDDYYTDYSPWYRYYYGGDRLYPFFWERDDFSPYYTRYRRNRRGRSRRSETEPPAPPAPPATPPPELTTALKVTDLDLHVKKNAKAHHTGKFECVRQGQSVVRRGGTMEITVTFNRKYDIEINDAKIEMSTGENAKPSNGTQTIMKLIEDEKKKLQPTEWGAKLLEQDENSITIKLQIPANCIIGRWNMLINTIVDGKDESGEKKKHIFSYRCNQDIIILFNPWCQDDGVHMAPERLLNTYILDNEGLLFYGYWKRPTSGNWIYGQFLEGVLEAALYILLAGFGAEPSKLMSDPVIVARVLAKMVNAQDDRGVLVGNWSGNYDDGTSPLKWKGSRPILKEFMEKKMSVQYGQCWVFASVLTTVCRALGIPCRSVTNFSSAHDTDRSNTIDKFFDTEGEEIEYLNRDSVWNFHVWNEVWMTRPDLNETNMNGWQVIDATPQEESFGVYTCGPAPKAAVKNGLCGIMYDTSFVFSEVNADEVHWTKNWDFSFERKKLITDSVGKSMYTEDPNFKDKGMDIKHEYKYEENSVQERNAVMMAHKTAEFKRDVYSTPAKDEEIEFHVEFPDELLVGEQLKIRLWAKNIGMDTNTVEHAKITVSPKIYTGEVGRAFFKREFDPFRLKPGETKNLPPVTLKTSDYRQHLAEGAYLYILATAVVPEDWNSPQQTIYKGDDFKFRMPKLDIQGPDVGTLDEPISFTISFTNPLDVPLTKCDVSIESAGFEDKKDIRVKDVAANGTFGHTFKVKPTTAGEHSHYIIFTFDSKELPDITAKKSVSIRDDDED